MQQTHVKFHVLPAEGAGIWQQHICHILAACHSQKQTVFVLCEDKRFAKALDAALWTFSDVAFVPHALAVPPYLAENTAPILIGNSTDLQNCTSGATRDILCNLTTALPAENPAFSHILEWVPVTAAEKEAARARYQQYKQRGYVVETQTL